MALLRNGGIPVSLFIEPDLAQVKAAHKISADFVELHTGRYANARRAKEADAEVEAITQAARLAYKLGLGVNAGHGLNYQNVKRLTHVSESWNTTSGTVSSPERCWWDLIGLSGK